MSYRTILVHADLSRHAPDRIRVAAQLARACGAHLAGLAATGVSRTIFPQGCHPLPGSLEASYFDPLHARAEQALVQFGKIAAEADVSHESRLVWDLASDALARMARFSDLVVVSQDDPEEALADTGGRIPEYVALTGARPVLMLPCVPVGREPGRHVLVAWNGSKEASAAMNAALPLLRRAGRVRIVSFRDPGMADAMDAQCEADLAAFLARHAVRAEIMASERHIDSGHALLAMAAQEACDLIVMGCYGHSRFRELILGGVTRTVLFGARLPVLMAR